MRINEVHIWSYNRAFICSAMIKAKYISNNTAIYKMTMFGNDNYVYRNATGGLSVRREMSKLKTVVLCNDEQATELLMKYLPICAKHYKSDCEIYANGREEVVRC